MTAATQTLPAWLLDQIAEDEARANVASPGPWHADAERATVLAVDDIEVCDGFALSGPQLRATTEHIATWDPARVLAECEAKRRIVERHRPQPGHKSAPRCSECGGTDWRPDAQGVNEPHPWVMPWPCPTLRDLAAIYADREGWREEWGVAR